MENKISPVDSPYNFSWPEICLSKLFEKILIENPLLCQANKIVIQTSKNISHWSSDDQHKAPLKIYTYTS